MRPDITTVEQNKRCFHSALPVVAAMHSAAAAAAHHTNLFSCLFVMQHCVVDFVGYAACHRLWLSLQKAEERFQGVPSLR